MPGRVNGFSLAYTAAGGVVLWSGIKGTTISDTFRNLLSGKGPGGSTEPIGGAAPVNQTTAADTAIGNASGGPVTASTVTSIQNYGLARMVAGTYGWAGGQEWAALTEVINRESGGNPDAMNASGAYGIAQALGHAGPGDAGSVSSTAYGGYGVPASTCQAANSGNASAQLVWMMAYIKATYGDPIGAWNSEQSRGYY